MRMVYATGFALGLALLMPTAFHAQGQRGAAQGMQGMQDTDRVVKNGGIFAPGWKGAIDAAAAKQGMSTSSSRFAAAGGNFELMTGPAGIYWRDADTATGDYTVKATFKDLKSDAGHPHAIGLFIGGKNLEGAAPSYTYCLAYTNGTARVNQFTDGKVTTLSRQAPNDAIKKAGADGLVTNEMSWVVKGSSVQCMVNGTAVATLEKSAVPTDGIFGIRVNHNISATVVGFGK